MYLPTTVVPRTVVDDRSIPCTRVGGPIAIIDVALLREWVIQRRGTASDADLMNRPPETHRSQA